MTVAERHDKFAEYIALGMRQVDAYRAAISPDATDASAYSLASRLVRDVKVMSRIQAFQTAIRQARTDKMVYRYEDQIAELEQLRILGIADGDYGVALGAVKQKGKVSGLEVDPKRNNTRPFDGITDAEIDREIEKAQAEVKAQEQAGATRH
jgi:hypothetical protein